jgi:hypothetical protein
LEHCGVPGPPENNIGQIGEANEDAPGERYRPIIVDSGRFGTGNDIAKKPDVIENIWVIHP